MKLVIIIGLRDVSLAVPDGAKVGTNYLFTGPNKWSYAVAIRDADTTLFIDRGRLRQTLLRRRMIIQVIEESPHSVDIFNK